MTLRAWKRPSAAALAVAMSFGLAARAAYAEGTGTFAPPALTDRPAAGASEVELAARGLMALLDDIAPSEAWRQAARLADLGPDAVPIVLNGLDGAGEVRKLALAQALCLLGESDTGGRTLLDLVWKAPNPEVRICAARAVGLTPALIGREAVASQLRYLTETERDLLVRIAIADSFLRVSRDRRAGLLGARGAVVEKLAEILEGPDEAAAASAALILGENGYAGRARTRLTQMAAEPTPEGRRALLCLDRDRPAWPDIIEEITDLIQRQYVDPEKVDADALIKAAARGMAESLDDYSTYLGQEEVQDMQEMMDSAYEGIGAYVGMRDGYFTIISPIYDGPAYRAGLRSLDRIVEVDGTPTAELGFDKTVKRLKGEKGTPVEVKLVRRGWAEPQGFRIVREKIDIPLTYSELLPGRIGYVKLTSFGTHSARDVSRGLRELKDRGAQAFVFDLRDNGGGLLDAAVGVSDLFLPSGKVIVYSKGREDVAPLQSRFSRTSDRLGGAPLVVLVNSGSASASEIVAGCLQDWGRARLVGERTFGKGSVQSLLPLRSTGGKTELRITVAWYYLPSQRCIDRRGGTDGGIEPDVTVSGTTLSGWESEEAVRIGLVEKTDAYVSAAFGKDRETFERLADSDGKSLDAYPGLREVYAGLGSRISEEAVRLTARHSVRRHTADARGRRFVTDLQEDRVLRRGVFELLMQTDAADPMPEMLRGIVEEFRAAAEKEAAEKANDPVPYAGDGD